MVTFPKDLLEFYQVSNLDGFFLEPYSGHCTGPRTRGKRDDLFTLFTTRRFDFFIRFSHRAASPLCDKMREPILVRASAGAGSPLLSLLPAAGSPAAATVVLFPGDISTRRADMERDPELRQWSQWCCEDLCRMLAVRWPACHAVVVHPPRSVGGFSFYDGWVPNIDAAGDAASYDGANGVACGLLLAQLRDAAAACGGSEEPLRLLAFSHGAVVLNQLVAEMGAPAPTQTAQQLALRVNCLCWLDPGLACEPGAGIMPGAATAASTMARLCGGRGPRHMHVALTPYQLQPRGWWPRYWRLAWRWPPLSRESDAAAATRRLAEVLRDESAAGVTITTEQCATDRPPGLDGHFAVLREFHAPWEPSREGTSDPG